MAIRKKLHTVSAPEINIYAESYMLGREGRTEAGTVHAKGRGRVGSACQGTPEMQERARGWKKAPRPWQPWRRVCTTWVRMGRLSRMGSGGGHVCPGMGTAALRQ